MPIENLPCKLTDKEVLDRTTKLLEALQAEDKLEAEKKAFSEEHKEAVTVAGSRVTRLRGIISARIEYRDTEVVENFDYKRGIVEVLRTDLSEVVRTRQMTKEERQAPLDLQERA